jgi:hypothetical protein
VKVIDTEFVLVGAAIVPVPEEMVQAKLLPEAAVENVTAWPIHADDGPEITGVGNALTVTAKLPFILIVVVLQGAAFAVAVTVKVCVPTVATAEPGIVMTSALPVPAAVVIVCDPFNTVYVTPLAEPERPKVVGWPKQIAPVVGLTLNTVGAAVTVIAVELLLLQALTVFETITLMEPDVVFGTTVIAFVFAPLMTFQPAGTVHAYDWLAAATTEYTCDVPEQTEAEPVMVALGIGLTVTTAVPVITV